MSKSTLALAYTILEHNFVQIQYHKYETRQKKSLYCAICNSKELEDEYKNYIKFKCGHSFHFMCIYEYVSFLIKQNTTKKFKCPYCRQLFMIYA